MFKLVVLSALLAVAVARPGLYESSPVVYSHPIVQEQVLAKVGSIVKSIPTAVSHQSSTVVHGSTHYVEPIVAPVVKTYAAPVVKTVYSPYNYAAAASPVHYTYAAAAPAHYTYAAVAAPAHYTYADTAPAHYTYQEAAPEVYASGW